MLKLNFNAPINVLSYGYTSLSLVKELDKLVDLALLPLHQPETDNADDSKFINDLINRRTYTHFNDKKSLFFHPKAPTIKLWHQPFLEQGYCGSPRIGFPIFELNKFTELEKASLSSCDYLFVPSQWGKDIIVKELGVEWEKKTYVVPLGVDRDIFKPSPRPRNSDFTILVVGKIEIRKAIESIPVVFNKAFQSSDNVKLLMSVDNPFLKPEEIQEWVNYYKNSPLGNKIEFVPRVKTRQEMSALMNSADCLLTLSKAEGFDLPALESLSVGLPIVATDYSAHTEFLSSKNAFLVHIDELETAYDGGKWFFGEEGFEWAKIGNAQINQAVSHLDSLYQDWKNQRDLINYAGIEIAQKFSWNHSAKKIVKILEEIC